MRFPPCTLAGWHVLATTMVVLVAFKCEWMRRKNRWKERLGNEGFGLLTSRLTIQQRISTQFHQVLAELCHGQVQGSKTHFFDGLSIFLPLLEPLLPPELQLELLLLLCISLLPCLQWGMYSRLCKLISVVISVVST